MTDRPANRDGSSCYTLAGTVQTNPSILSPVAHSTDRRQAEAGFNELITGLNRKIATLGVAIVEKFFPPHTCRLQELRQLVLDAPLFGSPDNHSFSTAQVNISPLHAADLSTSLGYSGGSHIDKHDDPMSLSVLICLSLLPPLTDPGKFYLGETREWCLLQPFSVLIFRGTGPHGGTQAVPRHLKVDDEEMRITIILYPQKQFVNRTVGVLLPCDKVNKVADYSFFNDGRACFGTEAYYQAWCLRELFRHFCSSIESYGPGAKGLDLAQAFRFATGSQTRYVDPKSDYARSILDTIEKANNMLRGLRPPWQAATNTGRLGTTSQTIQTHPSHPEAGSYDSGNLKIHHLEPLKSHSIKR